MHKSIAHYTCTIGGSGYNVIITCLQYQRIYTGIKYLRAVKRFRTARFGGIFTGHVGVKRQLIGRQRPVPAAFLRHTIKVGIGAGLSGVKHQNLCRIAGGIQRVHSGDEFVGMGYRNRSQLPFARG